MTTQQVVFDYSQQVLDDGGLYLPPTLMIDTPLGQQYCMETEQSAASSKDTQKAATGFRAGRVFARIATGLTISVPVCVCVSVSVSVSGLVFRLLSLSLSAPQKPQTLES